MTSFVLAAVLTLIAFGPVMSHAFSTAGTIAGITVAAVVQVLVHLHYFLHLVISAVQRWRVVALVFTLLVLMIIVGGSPWLLRNRDYRLMGEKEPGRNADDVRFASVVRGTSGGAEIATSRRALCARARSR